MTDIVERLRALSRLALKRYDYTLLCNTTACDDCADAADEIERLRWDGGDWQVLEATNAALASENAKLRHARPIATAPRDGTNILVFSSNGWRQAYAHQSGAHEPEWFDDWGDILPEEPTHWMPLPDKPEGA